MRSILYKTAKGFHENPRIGVNGVGSYFGYEFMRGLTLEEIRTVSGYYKKKYDIDFMVCGEVLSPQHRSFNSIKERSLEEIKLICSKLKPNEQVAYFYKTNGLSPDPSHVQVLILKKDEVIIPIGGQKSAYVPDFNLNDFQKVGLRCFASPISSGLLLRKGEGSQAGDFVPVHPQGDDSSCGALGFFYLKKEMRSDDCLKFEYYNSEGEKQGLFIGSLQTLHYSQSEKYIDALEKFLTDFGESSEPTLAGILRKSIEKAREKKDTVVEENNQAILRELESKIAHWKTLFESEREKRGEKFGKYNYMLLIRQLMLRKKLFKRVETRSVDDPKLEILMKFWGDYCSRPENKMPFTHFSLSMSAIEENSEKLLIFLNDSFFPEGVDEDLKEKLLRELIFLFPSNIMKPEVLEKYFINFFTEEDISKLLVAAACYYHWELVDYLSHLKEPLSPSSDALIYALQHAAHMGNQEAFDKIISVLGDRLDLEQKEKLQALLSKVKDRAQFDLIEEIKNRAEALVEEKPEVKEDSKEKAKEEVKEEVKEEEELKEEVKEEVKEETEQSFFISIINSTVESESDPVKKTGEEDKLTDLINDISKLLQKYNKENLSKDKKQLYTHKKNVLEIAKTMLNLIQESQKTGSIDRDSLKQAIEDYESAKTGNVRYAEGIFSRETANMVKKIDLFLKNNTESMQSDRLVNGSEVNDASFFSPRSGLEKLLVKINVDLLPQYKGNPVACSFLKTAQELIGFIRAVEEQGKEFKSDDFEKVKTAYDNAKKSDGVSIDPEIITLIEKLDNCVERFSSEQTKQVRHEK